MTDPVLCHLCSKPVQPDKSHPYFFRCHRTCIERTNTRLMKAWAKKHPYGTQTEPGRRGHYGPADIRVLERDSAEGQAELARRAERRQAVSGRIDAEIAATGIPPVDDEQMARTLASALRAVER